MNDFYLGLPEEKLEQSKLLHNSSDSDSDPTSLICEQVFKTPEQKSS